MTVQQMHQQFKDELDKVDSLAVPNYLPSEIDRLLNEAQERFIKERLPVSRAKETTVEETQRRKDDLSAITKNFNTTAFVVNSDNLPNGSFITLPANYKYLLKQSAFVFYTNECGDRVDAEAFVWQRTHGQYEKVIRDPFWAPVNEEVLQLPFGSIVLNPNSNNHPDKVIEIITAPTATLTRYTMRYLREPATIDITNNVTCELGVTQAREIVKMAVAEVEKIITDPRYQTQKSELIATE